MGHKTHPIGLRLGVTPRGPITRGLAYQESEDLHGHASRWVPGNREESGSWTLRDLRLRTRLDNRLLEDGYLRNKCIIYRGATQLGIYVDAYKVSDRSLLESLLSSKDRGEKAAQRVLVERQEANADASSTVVTEIPSDHQADQPQQSQQSQELEQQENQLQRRISRHLRRETLISRREGGRPVTLRFYCLNSRLAQLPLEYWTKRKSLKVKTKFVVDRQNLTSLLRLAPVATAYSRGLAARLSQERHKVTLRAASDVLKQVSHSGLRRRGEEGEWGYLGYRLQLKGRIGGSERKGVQVHHEGVRPRGTRSSALDYGFGEADCTSGLVSVKRWVCYA